MIKIISFVLALLLLPIHLNAKELYLNCQQKLTKVRSNGGYLDEGFYSGVILVKLKNSRIEAFHSEGQSGYQFFFDEKIEKNNLGFEASLKWEDNEFKNSEILEIIKPIDEYVFKRSSYFWAKKEPKDTITDFDSSGRCKIIEREDYKKGTIKFR